MRRIPRLLMFAVAAALAAIVGLADRSAEAQKTVPNIDLAVRPEFHEPVTLKSKDGVLEVKLIAKQGTMSLDTVAVPVRNALVHSYEVIRGTASNGEMSGSNMYPAPTLQVFPGDTLIVHLDNALTDLTIKDFFDPAYTAKGEEVPLYPPQLRASPLNLHVHGVHVSPRGNADNVMLHIPAGRSNTYTYNIPKTMPQGAYWYHSHLHTLTAAHAYFGLVGLLAIGRTDGNLPLVTENGIPVRNMLLQYNYVFDRAEGGAQINNYTWTQWVSTIKPPKGEELAKGTYRPLLTPVNFFDTKKGTEFFTVWYAGPLSIRNERGRFELIPSNLQRFTPFPGSTGKTIPADPALPDYKRDLQFTINGQFQPVIKSKAGQTEIWVLANVSDIAYVPVQLTETATGNHPKIAIVGQDGVPYPDVQYPIFENGTRLLIPPASRYAIAVTMPSEGDLVLEMPPRGGGASTISAPGVLYTNDGTDNPPAVLGSLSVLPEAVSYYDGFFVSPTQVLARATTSGGKGVTTMFAEGQKLGAYTVFEDLSKVTPDLERELVITGGFLNNLASTADAKSFEYVFQDMAFPYVPVLQPRLGSIEEWKFVNNNNDEHPIHIHVNDFQVTYYLDPTRGIETGPEMSAIDNANVPAPSMGAEEAVIQSGALNLRMRFDDFTGLFVMHCHRLNHEDNGLMMMVNVIPAVSTYAVAVPGAKGRPAQVKIYDGAGDKLVTTVTPFPDFEGTPSVVMGDVNDDGVYDLLAGAGKDHAPEVVAYSGKASEGKKAFETELVRFQAFDAAARGGVAVAAAPIDGSTGDNIIVGSGPGAPSEVKVYRSDLPSQPGAAPSLFSSFAPYADDRSGVSLAAGFVDFATGRHSIVTAPGPGSATQVKVFVYPLMPTIGPKTKNASLMVSGKKASDMCPEDTGKPNLAAAFMPFGLDYKGGVSLATGWLGGKLGGAERIVVGQLAGNGQVKVFSGGSALQGGPALYLAPADHSPIIAFGEMASFTPFDGSSGVSVATTSTTVGADLLVSGRSAKDNAAEVVKYQLARPSPQATNMVVKPLATVVSTTGAEPDGLGGD
jgi:FtsP/CotA-like multicopper oxidase with cupredoxin domain